MLICLLLLLRIRKLDFLPFLMVMEVFRIICRGIVRSFCRTPFSNIAKSKRQFQKRRLLKSFKINIFKNGWAFVRRSWKKLDYQYTKIDEIKIERSQLRLAISCWVYSQCSPCNSLIYILCKRRRFPISSLYRKKSSSFELWS